MFSWLAALKLFLICYDIQCRFHLLHLHALSVVWFVWHQQGYVLSPAHPAQRRWRPCSARHRWWDAELLGAQAASTRPPDFLIVVIPMLGPPVFEVHLVRCNFCDEAMKGSPPSRLSVDGRGRKLMAIVCYSTIQYPLCQPAEDIWRRQNIQTLVPSCTLGTPL